MIEVRCSKEPSKLLGYVKITGPLGKGVIFPYFDRAGRLKKTEMKTGYILAFRGTPAAVKRLKKAKLLIPAEIVTETKP